jgi:hypothetical protein
LFCNPQLETTSLTHFALSEFHSEEDINLSVYDLPINLHMALFSSFIIKGVLNIYIFDQQNIFQKHYIFHMDKFHPATGG